MGGPTRAQIEQWRTDQLGAAAKNWGEVADHVEFILNAAKDAIKSPIGKGQFLDKFKESAEAVIAKTPHQIERLRAAKTAAETSEADLKNAKNSAVSAITDAEAMISLSTRTSRSLTGRRTRPWWTARFGRSPNSCTRGSSGFAHERSWASTTGSPRSCTRSLQR